MCRTRRVGWWLTVLVGASLLPACAAEPGGSSAALHLPGHDVGPHLYVAAHPDDDFLFMSPDVERAVLAGFAVRTIYVTSGDAGREASYWHEREDGVRSAYAAMARVADAWSCSARSYAGKTAALCTLSARPSVSLLFLRLPDMGLAPLWSTDDGPPFWVSPASSLATVDGASRYTRAELVRVLAAVIAEVAPERVGATDGTLAYGDDHSDHIASGMFVLEAIHAAHGVHQVRLYRGYSMYQTWSSVPAPEARNLTSAEHDEKDPHHGRLLGAAGAGRSLRRVVLAAVLHDQRTRGRERARRRG